MSVAKVRNLEWTKGSWDMAPDYDSRLSVKTRTVPGGLEYSPERTVVVTPRMHQAPGGKGSNENWVEVTRDEGRLVVVPNHYPGTVFKAPAGASEALEVYVVLVAIWAQTTGAALRPGDVYSAGNRPQNSYPPQEVGPGGYASFHRHSLAEALGYPVDDALAELVTSGLIIDTPDDSRFHINVYGLRCSALITAVAAAMTHDGLRHIPNPDHAAARAAARRGATTVVSGPLFTTAPYTTLDPDGSDLANTFASAIA